MLSQVKKSCIQCTTPRCIIYRTCDEEWKNKFDHEKGVNVYRKGEYIFREGFPIVGIYFVHSGKVKLVSITENGKEHVVRFAKDGHLLGHLGSNSEKYTLDAVAMEDSIICFIKNELFRASTEHSPPLLTELMMYYSCELRKSEIRSRNIALMNVKERIAYSLLLLLNAFGNPRESGKILLPIKISGADLAKIAGTTPEEICRTMSIFKRQGIISVEKKYYSIQNLEKLENLVGGYSHEWSCCEKAF